MMNMRFALGTVLVAIVLVIGAGNVAGAADFYKGKTVRMVVSSSPAAVTTPTRVTSPDTFTGIFRALRG